jgi:hypothetical protein
MSYGAWDECRLQVDEKVKSKVKLPVRKKTKKVNIK